MTIHLIKLAVGAKSLDDVATWQTSRARANPPLRHRTRSMPKRRDEILDGGSIYWVVAGVLIARQRLKDIVAAQREDGTDCTDLILDPKLIPVRGRPVKPFQGWRYLPAHEAPDDLPRGEEAALPENLRRELATLCLL